MDDTDITSKIRKYMENKAHFDHIGYGFIRKHYVPWFGKRGEIEPLLNNIEKEYSKLCEENVHLNKIYSNKLSKLDPCPWCGKTPHFLSLHDHENSKTWFSIICDTKGCNAASRNTYFSNPEDAVKSWNTRQ